MKPGGFSFSDHVPPLKSSLASLTFDGHKEYPDGVLRISDFTSLVSYKVRYWAKFLKTAHSGNVDWVEDPSISIWKTQVGVRDKFEAGQKFWQSRQ